jgi:DNA modification methylase
MADYILLFRAPGENIEPIDNDVSNEEWIRWARPIWYAIRESATLQAEAARAEDDEKHIAPLQLETCERCIRLWSNRGETVLDPFAGIGTTGHVAVQCERHFIGIELKPEYYREAVLNLSAATKQESLNFADERIAGTRQGGKVSRVSGGKE